MKIQASIFKSFIKKASLDGRIMTINLNFTEEGVKSAVRDAINVSLTSTFLNKNSFENYKPIGEIFIKHSEHFLKYITTFTNYIDLEVIEDYILKVSDEDRTGYILLGSEKVCENLVTGDLPKIDTTVTINLSKDELGRAVSDVAMLKINQIEIETIGDKLNMSVGEKGTSDSFVNIITLKEKQGDDAKVKVNECLLSFFNAVDKNFEMKIGTDVPLVLHEKTDNIDFTCILAPIAGVE